jgi:hypothetical protein
MQAAQGQVQEAVGHLVIFGSKWQKNLIPLRAKRAGR